MDQKAAPGPGTKAARSAPPPALWAFLLLLGALFTGACAVGQAVGPVAPGMHGPGLIGDGPARDGEMPMDHGSGH
ncbi:hypothetical protein ABZW50_13050 [Streptomyces bacillaris]